MYSNQDFGSEAWLQNGKVLDIHFARYTSVLLY